MAEDYLSDVRETVAICFEEPPFVERESLEDAARHLVDGRPSWESLALLSAAAHTASWWQFTEKEVDDWVHAMLTAAQEPLERNLLVYEAESIAGILPEDESRCYLHCLCAAGFSKWYLDDREVAVKLIVRAATMAPASPAEWVAGQIPMQTWKDVFACHMMLAILGFPLSFEGYDAEAALLQTELIACGWNKESAFNRANEVLESLSDECLACEAQERDVVPYYGWVDLLAEAAMLVRVSQECDDDGEEPGKCRQSSAQYWAWRFGTFVAQLVSCDGVVDDPIGSLHRLWLFASYDTDIFVREREVVLGALDTAVAIVSDSVAHDVRTAREWALALWQSRVRSFGVAPWDVGPKTDLYWAMRIGLYDELVSIQNPFEPPMFAPQPSSEGETGTSVTAAQIVEGMGLGFAKIQGQLNEVLKAMSEAHPESDAIRETLRRNMDDDFDSLPVGVVDHLVQGERFWATEVDHEQAAVAFVCAVEAAVYSYFTAPFLDYMSSKRVHRATLLFPGQLASGSRRASVPRTREFHRSEIETLDLRDLAGCLRALSRQEDFDACHKLAPTLLDFLVHRFGWWNDDCLDTLATRLERCVN